MKGLVLHSGGLDSTVVLALAQIECPDGLISLSFSYGQKHERELRAAKILSEHYGAKHLEISVGPEIFLGSGSSLLKSEGKSLPQASYEELRAQEGPSPTYVPFRNGIFLSLASAAALSLGYEMVYFGAHADDAHNWAYPDCTPEFIGSMSAAAYIGTYSRVRLKAPFQHLTKAEIVRRGVELSVPFVLTYSCYEGRELHCGRCPTCLSRKEAFRQALVPDPTQYIEVLNSY